MQKFFDIQRWKLYLLIGFAFLIFWLLHDLINYSETFGERVVNNFWRVIYVTFLNYVLYEFTLPFIARRRKSILYNILAAIPLLFAFCMLYSWGLLAWRELGVWSGIWTPLTTFESPEDGATRQMSYSMGSIVFFGVVRHLYNHLKLKQAAQQLRIEKQEAELNYLKSQTNPHFLFNTLNNIYALTRDKSDLAPESVLRLSKLLRYMLYEAGGDFIAIEQEVKIISDYIELEKLRYDESLSINFNHNVEDMKQAIPPLLLMPLVENAFKHGVSETRGRSFVDVHLSVYNRNLLLVVKNSSEAVSGTIKENIGLSNLRRQLELLYREYELCVDHEAFVFTASLKINLASHA